MKQRHIILIAAIVAIIVIGLAISHHYATQAQEEQNVQEVFSSKPKVDAEPVSLKWEYATVEWHEMEFDKDYHPDQVYVTFIDFPNDFGWRQVYGSDGTEVTTLDELLRYIGNAGWELASSEDGKYVFKRKSDGQSKADFNIERRWKPMK